jgi:ribosome-binding protein aMBF1 (putative translation factor)
MMCRSVLVAALAVKSTADSMMVEPPELDDHGKVFLAGFMEGFVGDAKHIKACASESMQAVTDVQHFVADLKAKKWEDAVPDLQALVTDVLDDIATCKKIGKDLGPFMSILKDVHGIKDILQKVENNFLAHDKQILDILEDMLEVCTFGSPDAHKCGEDAGKQVRALVVSDKSVSQELQDHGKVFLAGFMDGFLGDAKHIKACISDSAKVGSDAGHLMADLMAKNWNSTIADVEALVTDAIEDVKVCKDIGKDLAPFIGAIKDVHGIKDIIAALKKNFLDNDKKILKILEDMIEVCTFGSPDANKCGEDAGKQVRALLVGDTVVV